MAHMCVAAGIKHDIIRKRIPCIPWYVHVRARVCVKRGLGTVLGKDKDLRLHMNKLGMYKRGCMISDSAYKDENG